MMQRYALATLGFGVAAAAVLPVLDNDPAVAFRQLQPIRPETITSYEVGVKSDFLDDRVRLNAAGFYYQYHDLQIFNLVPAAANGGLPVNVLTNAPRATIKGLDAELDAKPLPDLTLGLSLGYLDTALGTFVNGAGATAPVSIPASNFRWRRGLRWRLRQSTISLWSMVTGSSFRARHRNAHCSSSTVATTR